MTWPFEGLLHCGTMFGADLRKALERFDVDALLEVLGINRHAVPHAEIERRLAALRQMLIVNPDPHVSEIYDALGDDASRHGTVDSFDRIGDLRGLTNRFVAGFMTAEEYDRALRAAVGATGRGAPRR